MRLAGTIGDSTQARRFQDYLTTIGIECLLREKPEPTVGSFGVWILEEDTVERAREELERFLVDPEEGRYVSAERQAVAVRSKEKARRDHRAAREIEFSRRWTPPTWKDVPITLSLILLSVSIEWILVSSGLPTAQFKHHPLGSDLLISPSVAAGQAAASWIPPEIRGGQVWRILSPILLHFGVVHLAMNSLAMFWLGVAIEGRRGTARFAGLALVVSILSNYAQYLWAPNPFGGLSGLIFGMVGYAWMKSRFEPRYGIHLSPVMVAFCLFWMVLCIVSGQNVANAAHVVGLLAGVVIGVVPTLWRRLTQQS